MNYTYDARGGLTILNGQAKDIFNTQFKQTLAYFDNSNIQSMPIQNTGNGDWPELTFNYQYDDLNRLTQFNSNLSNFSETFTYDDNGNRIQKLFITDRANITFATTQAKNSYLRYGYRQTENVKSARKRTVWQSKCGMGFNFD